MSVLIYSYVSSNVYGDEDKKSVLFISSYNISFLSVPDQIEGIRSVLEPNNILLDVEFMDSKRFDDLECEKAFYDILNHKLDRLNKYDAIIVGDDNALQFAMDYQDNLFKDIPIIFLGVNDLNRAKLASDNKYITGVIEEYFIKENIELGMKFNKNATKVVAIVDDTLTGIGDRNQFYQYEEEYEKLDFFDINVSEYTFKELEQVFQELDEDTILFYLSMYKDKENNNLTINEAVDILREYTNVPVYRAGVGGVGRGVLGGKMVSYVKSGEIAAKMVLEYFQGTSIESIEMVENTPYEYVFDYNIIKKYKIDEDLIPKDSILINKNISFYEQNKSLVRNTLVVIVFLLAISITLSIDNIKRRKIEKELKDSNEELSQIYEELTASELELRTQYDTIQKHANEIEIYNKKYEHLANHDYVTDLPNRMNFINRLRKEISAGNSGTVVMLDIDDFKRINDTLGHVFGDKMIIEISNKLSVIADKQLFVSRFGGDEFLILISNEDNVEEIEKCIKKIMRQFEEALILNYEENYVSFSIGITQFPKDSTDVDRLIMNADTAMYKVKHSGKNNYMFYRDEMQEELKEKTEIEAILRKAIKTDGFTLVYQPQVNVNTGEVIGFEALIRLREHNISPGIFIAVAEETGLIIEIGRWVTREAIEQIAKWKEKGFELKPVAINFSSKQLRDSNYFNFLQTTLYESNVDPKYLEIEITESFLLEKTDNSIKFLNKLKEIGIKIALDDFGTGFSSLNYLTFIPVNKIKLDKSLCEKFLGLENVKVMNSLIALAHSLNLEITAEGIEEVEQYNRLKDGGCDYIQGYLFSKPLKVEEIELLYNSNLLERII
jgi:diguanylate cyclase (GGDEF)-like protein